MTRTLYLNGDWLPESEAKISVFDRGFLMADGIYEVTCVLDGKLIDYAGHAARLQRSAREMGLALPLSEAELLAAHREIVARNGLDQGLIYLQLTRGVAERDFVYPPAGTPPTLVMLTQARNVLENAQAESGIRVALLPDLRWGRRDIKTVQLLYPCMAKMEARARGADDAWLVEDGFVTEGTSNNAYIVANGTIVTRALSHDILHGITRAAVLRFADEAQMKVEERNFTVAEAQAADEAFITSSSMFVMPVVQIDDAEIGTGKPGPVAARLREIYLEESRKSAI